MIRYSDREDLPAPILRAIEDPYYDQGMQGHWDSLPDDLRAKYVGNQFSATTLPRAPRQRMLFIRHSEKVLVDPLSAFWKIFGHTIHEILQKYGNDDDLVEHRLGVDLDGTYVHGQVDRYIPGMEKIQDWKITKAEAMLYDDRFEYVAQQNILAWIFRQNGLPVTEIELVYLFRNLDRRKYVEGGQYPKEEVLASPLPVWSDEECLEYIWGRVTAHKEAEDVADDDLPQCTDTERWMGKPVFRVYKVEKGAQQKRAKHVSNTRLECEDWIPVFLKEEKSKWDEREKKRVAKLKKGGTQKAFTPPELVIVETKPDPIRCSFCEISDFCNQQKAWRAANRPDES